MESSNVSRSFLEQYRSSKHKQLISKKEVWDKFLQYINTKCVVDVKSSFRPFFKLKHPIDIPVIELNPSDTLVSLTSTCTSSVTPFNIFLGRCFRLWYRQIDVKTATYFQHLQCVLDCRTLST